jgi:raffinose/stachyose/melibiose transport system permease protein
MSAIRFRLLPRHYEQQEMDKQRRQVNKALLVTLFILPGMALFTVFVLMSVPQSAYYSLYDWNGLGPLTDYVGLDNYTRLLDHGIFQMALGHSFVLMTLSLFIQLPLSLGLALLVGRGKLPGRKVFRTILFVPYVFSEVITAIIWLFVLHPQEGLLNTVLASVIPGFEPIGWLADRNTVLYVLFMVVTWKYFGFHMILYMAGLQAIPADLEDAARVDGATEGMVLRHVTLPLLGSTIRLTIFLSVLGSFQQFVIFWRLTQGGPVNGSELIATYLYKYGIQRFSLGYGGAIAVVLFAVTLVFSLGYQRMMMRQDYVTEPR